MCSVVFNLNCRVIAVNLAAVLGVWCCTSNCTVCMMGNEDSTMWSGYDLAKFACAAVDFGHLVKEMKNTINCDHDSDVTLQMFEEPSKDVLAKHLFDVFQCIKNYSDVFPTARIEIENMKSELIKSQKSVIQLQGELLSLKDKEPAKTAVKAAEVSPVQAESKSNNSAVSKRRRKLSRSQSVITIPTQNLRKMVHFAEEDRSKNIVIFGLQEDVEEKLKEKIGDMFDHMEEKLRFVAARVGDKSTDKGRPVKVVLGSPGTANRILVKAKDLRLSEQYKTVFISPDRSPEEHAEHNAMVLNLKKRVKEDPNERYFMRIINGELLFYSKC